MQYRGEDLDLRTPARGSMSGEAGAAGEPTPYYNGPRARAGASGLARSEPIWVDEAVLGVCNHAFELARAHRSREVRLEHLLHAMATVEVAAEALEARGFRVSSLRRESGAMIADEVPAQMANGKAAPRRADELEDVLRSASERAGQRGSAAGLDDLIDALLELERDGPVLALLRRTHVRPPEPAPAQGYVRTPYVEKEPPRDPAPAPAYVRTSYVEKERERVRMPAGSSYVEQPMRAARDSLLSATDSVQNTRIETLEQMVRALHTDLMGERKAFSGMLQEMQRQLAEQREDSLRVVHTGGAGLAAERLKSIETSLESRLASLEHALQAARTETARHWAGVSERLMSADAGIEGRMSALEQTVQAAKSDGARNWAGLAERLKSFELTLSARPPVATDTAQLSARLSSIEQSLKDRLTDTSLEIVQLADKLKVLEDGQAAQRTQSLQLSSAIAADVKELGQRIAGQPSGETRVQALLSERFQSLAAMLDRQRSEIGAMVANAVERQRGEIAAYFTNVVERQRGEVAAVVSGPLERQRGEIAALVAQVVAERIGQATATMEARHAELARHLSAIGERIGGLEHAMTGYVQKFAESAAAYDQDLGEIQQAMLKLNANQQTLANTIDQWRLEGAGDISVIANRAQSLESSFQQQVQAIQGLSGRFDVLHRTTVERVERRNRFWYWLFGTDSWIRSSWQGKPMLPAAARPQTPPPPPAPPAPPRR